MSTKLRIATFNLENLDDKVGVKPTLAERIALMRPQLLRLNADILCLQEVNGQKEQGITLLRALDKLLVATPYSTYQRACTQTEGTQQPFELRNLVILSRFEILEHKQYRNTFVPPLLYRPVTAIPAENTAAEVTWDRPLLHVSVHLDSQRTLHVINAHLKSKLPTDIRGQKVDQFTWKSAAAWAEGSFISSIKRVGQALEVRQLVDAIFDSDEKALVTLCGDFNADYDEVTIEAIRGDVENHGNARLAQRVIVPCERSVPEPARYSLFHHGRGVMLDHILASRSLLQFYRHTEIHNEILHDESVAFGVDQKFPESDHAPVVAEFDLFDVG